MHRREFLIRSIEGSSVLLLLPAGWAVTGCGGTSYGSGNTMSSTVAGLMFTSSTVSGHNHAFTIAMTDLDQPPSAGVSGDTTAAAGHTHTVALTQADLQQISAGQSVSKTTSVAQDHEHTFDFSRASGVSTGGTGGAGGAGGGTVVTGTGTY